MATTIFQEFYLVLTLLHVILANLTQYGFGYQKGKKVRETSLINMKYNIAYYILYILI